MSFQGWFQCGFKRVATVEIYLSLMNPKGCWYVEVALSDVLKNVFWIIMGPQMSEVFPEKVAVVQGNRVRPKMCPSKNI